MDRIKRLSTEILSEYKDTFGTDFTENKKFLNEITIVRSKSLKNKIAGYITKILLREQKFQAHKQKLIDDEKQFLERNKADKKEKTPEPAAEPVEKQLDENSHLFAVRTTGGQEKIVMRMLEARLKMGTVDLQSVLL